MATSDFQVKKKLTAKSYSGSPSYNKAYMFRIVGEDTHNGTDQDTGGGDIVVDWDDFQETGGADFRVYDSDESTLLDYTIIEWDDSAEEATIMFNDNITFDGTDTVWIAYGQSGATDSQNQSGTFPSTVYNAVYPMQDTSGTDISGNDNNGTFSGSPNTETGHITSTAVTFDGTDDEFDAGFFNATGTENRGFFIIADVKGDPGGNTSLYRLGTGGSPSERYFVESAEYDTGNYGLEVGGGEASYGVSIQTGWGVTSARSDGSTHTAWVNGTSGSNSQNINTGSQDYSSILSANGGWELAVEFYVLLDSDFDDTWHQIEYDQLPTGGQDVWTQSAAQVQDSPGHIRQTKSGAIVETKSTTNGIVQKTNT